MPVSDNSNNHIMRKSNMAVMMALLVAFANLCGVLAKVGCNCHIGVREGIKIIDYGEIDSYRRLSSGKQRKCSDSCASWCVSDIRDGDKICRAIGIEYDNRADNIGCFSVVGRNDSKNKKWDYDGRATFTACERVGGELKAVY